MVKGGLFLILGYQAVRRVVGGLEFDSVWELMISLDPDGFSFVQYLSVIRTGRDAEDCIEIFGGSSVRPEDFVRPSAHLDVVRLGLRTYTLAGHQRASTSSARLDLLRHT